MDRFEQRLRALGITQEELSEAVAHIEARPDHKKLKRTDNRHNE